MIISDNGIELIKSFEGFRSKPYLCSAGVPTIGYGSTYYSNTKKVKLTDPAITKEKATELLMLQLFKYNKAVKDSIKVELSQNELDALVSMCYNIGIAGFKNSKLVKNINENNRTQIKENFLAWRFVNKKENKGLKTRRLKEYELFIKK